jgi:hypothetical protein
MRRRSSNVPSGPLADNSGQTSSREGTADSAHRQKVAIGDPYVPQFEGASGCSFRWRHFINRQVPVRRQYQLIAIHNDDTPRWNWASDCPCEPDPSLILLHKRRISRAALTSSHKKRVHRSRAVSASRQAIRRRGSGEKSRDPFLDVARRREAAPRGPTSVSWSAF